MQFSPNNHHLLSLDWATQTKLVGRLWRLDKRQLLLNHEFKQIGAIKNAVFSPNGKYLLTPHTDSIPDQLWKLTGDTITLIHTFKNPLRPPSVFDADGLPMGSVYFSPDNQYLTTYADTPQSADSLWQITGQRPGVPRLVPIHGFRNRLKAGHTVFSPDGQFLITEENGIRPAMVWNIPLQIPLLSTSLATAKQALFSPKGNFLLTNKTAWHITDRLLEPFQHPVDFPVLANCRISNDERYLMHSTPINYDPDKPPTTALYKLKTSQLDLVDYVKNDTIDYGPRLEGGVMTETYQTGLFSPDGRQWLKSQLAFALPDTLWHLTPAGLLFSIQPEHRIDKYIINNADRVTIHERRHSLPAALFSPDGKFLLTKEKSNLRFYQLKPTPMPSASLAGQKGWPLAVSANTTYWLTQTPANSAWESALLADRDSMNYPALKGELIISETPDTAKLWSRNGTTFKQLALFTNLYDGLNRYWQGNRRQSWFSAAGNYLLMPTTKPTLTTLYTIVGDKLRPVVHLNARLLTGAYVVPSPQDGWEAGLLYTDNKQQTYLLRHGSQGTRKTPLGFGVLEYPPRFSDKLAYWVRKIDESQQNTEILDLVSGTTLVQIPFGSVLDFTVRPNGDAWVVSTKGARLIRSPASTLRWLKQAPIAPLQSGLRQLYSFQ